MGSMCVVEAAGVAGQGSWGQLGPPALWQLPCHFSSANSSYTYVWEWKYGGVSLNQAT